MPYYMLFHQSHFDFKTDFPNLGVGPQFEFSTLNTTPTSSQKSSGAVAFTLLTVCTTLDLRVLS